VPTTMSSTSCSRYHRHLPSFPTRRSSDLAWWRRFASRLGPAQALFTLLPGGVPAGGTEVAKSEEARPAPPEPSSEGDHGQGEVRSEEHTSELQSRENLVCRLLLEKKKKTL